ncbi:DsbA family protein [Photobacterium minamisatsumaniensis]|uniref:DsbA family protein n=1 Tax=Photobacterium minamisatsumaniensis TaxID=2910233 RepID=UPI003D11CE1B
MKKSFIAAAVAVSSLVATPTAFASNLTTQQQDNLSQIEALLEQNPQIIDGLLTSLNMYVDQQNKQGDMLSQYHDWIYKNPSHSTMGNDDATLTIVNVTDYNCPFCKRLNPVLEQLVEEQPDDIRVVNIYVDFHDEDVDALGGTSSAEFALNVWAEQPENYGKVHQMLYRRPQQHDYSSLTRIAEATGTKDSLKRQNVTNEMVEKNHQMFTDIGISGTPGMIIGNEVISGYMPIEQLRPIVEELLAQHQKESIN